jgi:hypothetical protein
VGNDDLKVFFYSKVTAGKLFSQMTKKKYFPAEIFRISLAFAFIFTSLYGVAYSICNKTKSKKKCQLFCFANFDKHVTYLAGATRRFPKKSTG